MSKRAYHQIVANHLKRHAHRTKADNTHCDNCGAFISIPENESGRVRVQCSACQHWILKYVKPAEKARSD